MAGSLPQRAQSAVGPAPARRGAPRQSRPDDLRRARAASEVLRVAFPEVERLRIELRFEDPSSATPAAQVHMLYAAARAFFTYPCPHSDCDGEFELDGTVRSAVSDSSHAAQGSVLCRGARPGEKGCKRPCELRLVYAITADHHGDT